MKLLNIGNSYSYYKKCTHYLRCSDKWIKSMRIANTILSKVFPDYKFIHCEAMFPNYNSKFITIKKLGVNIVCEKSIIHADRIFFSFFI